MGRVVMAAVLIGICGISCHSKPTRTPKILCSTAPPGSLAPAPLNSSRPILVPSAPVQQRTPVVGVPVVPAQPVPAGVAVEAVPTPAVEAVPAVPATPGVQAVPAIPGMPATPGIAATPSAQPPYNSQQNLPPGQFYVPPGQGPQSQQVQPHQGVPQTQYYGQPGSQYPPPTQAQPGQSGQAAPTARPDLVPLPPDPNQFREGSGTR